MLHQLHAAHAIGNGVVEGEQQLALRIAAQPAHAPERQAGILKPLPHILAGNLAPLLKPPIHQLAQRYSCCNFTKGTVVTVPVQRGAQHPVLSLEKGAGLA